MFVTSQGSTRTQFRRALRSGDPVLVLTIAAELERIQAADAFAIVLVLADANDARYEKAASRLVARAANEAHAPLADVGMLASTLAVLPAIRDRERAARRAGSLLEELGCRGAGREVEEWIAARDAPVPRAGMRRRVRRGILGARRARFSWIAGTSGRQARSFTARGPRRSLSARPVWLSTRTSR